MAYLGQNSDVQTGKLRVYLGAAAGVGATFAMLDEACRRSERGTKVAIGCVETHARSKTTALLVQLDPFQALAQTLDVQSIISSHPGIVLVDDLGRHQNNDPASPYHWEIVQQILDAGIDVLATANIQHLASLVDDVSDIIGIAPEGFIPDRFLLDAQQVELVDATPEAIRRRIAHGNVFGPDDLRPQDADLFNSDAFAKLRLISLEWMASHIANKTNEALDLRERVVVGLNSNTDALSLLRRASRLAARSHGLLICLYVSDPSHEPKPSEIEKIREEVHVLGGTFHELSGKDFLSSLANFAKVEKATQIIIETPRIHLWEQIARQNSLENFADRLPGIDLHIIHASKPHLRKAISLTTTSISKQRQKFGFLFGFLSIALLTTVLTLNRPALSITTSLSLFLLAVVSTTAIGGIFPGLIAAFIAPFLVNWFLIPPYQTLRINDAENILELVVFVSVTTIVSIFVSQASRRSIEAKRAWNEASTLASLSEPTPSDSLDNILKLLLQTFQLELVTIVDTNDESHQTIAQVGNISTEGNSKPVFTSPISEGIILAAYGNSISADDYRVLQVFIGHLAKAIEQRHLREIALAADALERADELRTAILRSVSHDLRSPLASIKASVSTLRQTDVTWPEDTQQEFLSSIESETDRLTSIVTNLLDLSRLESGAMQPAIRAVSLEEVVPSVVHYFEANHKNLNLELPADIEDVAVDPALLERVISNLLDNAFKWSPSQSTVTIRAHQSGNYAQIHFIDHGPGISQEHKQLVRQPFHRVGDKSQNGGLGLGLAIADRLVESMNGRLELRDTPGGGLTSVVLLPIYRRFIA